MNFFKSILLDDPDPPRPDSPHDSDEDQDVSNPNDVVKDDDNSGLWNFGGLIKTIATRSESVLETYRKDLQEFGSGLKKETGIIREAASRAVKDLPASIEAGASVAQGALDGVLKSTAEIISKETTFFSSDGEPETPEKNQSSGSNRYSWFDSQLSVIQSDLATFTDEPEDVDEYNNWKVGFELDGKKDEIEGLIGENGSMGDVYDKLVPNVVDDETFWCRYFYRVFKLEQQEKVRANLVKRAISVDDDEELSWDVDDEDEVVNEPKNEVKVKALDEGVSDGSVSATEKPETSNNVVTDEKIDDKFSSDKKEAASEEVAQVKVDNRVKAEDVPQVKVVEEVKPEEVSQVKSDEKVKSEENSTLENVDVEKGKSIESSEKANDSKVEEEEEDLGWDEIEDVGSDDEKRTSSSTRNGSPKRAELRKRLSADEDDEDLSWDIEDDDEPVKA